MPVEFKGKRVVMGRLRHQINRIKGDARIGLLAAGIFVKTESQKVAPHDKGVLINSAYVGNARIAGQKQFVEVGYTAKYAPFVHEMPDSTNWSKQGTGAKFLQNPLFMNMAKILSIIKSRVRF